MLNIKCISSEDKFEEMEIQWNNLLAHSTANSPFLSWEWEFSWWQAINDDKHQLHIILVYDNDVLVGIAPFVVRTINFLGINLLKKIEFMGAELVSGEYLGIITTPEFEDKAIKGVLKYLSQNRKQWDFMELYPYREKSLVMSTFFTFCKQYKLSPFQCERHICPVISLPRDWDSFKQGLGRNKRRNIVREKKRLYENNNITFGKCRDLYEVEKELPLFFDLHQNKWISEGKAGTFASWRKRKFYELISQRFINKNWLNMYYLRVDGKPSAYLYGFLFNHRYYGLQSAHDPAFRHLSVGTVLLYNCLEQWIEEGVQEFDTLMGQEQWKYSLGAVPTRVMRMLVFKSVIINQIYQSLRNIKNLILRENNSKTN